MLRALENTPRKALTMTTLYYLSFIMLGLANASLGPTLPFLAARVGETLQGISILFAARSFGYLLGALFGARLYDHLRGHRLIAIVFLGVGLSLAAIPLIGKLWLMVIAMLLLGSFESTIDTGANTLLVWVHREKVGPFMNGLHFAFGVGAFLVPIIVAQATLNLGSPAWAYWLLGLLIIPLILLFLHLPSPQNELQPSQASTLPEAKTDTLVYWIALLFFFYAGVELSFGNWIYSYALKVKIADEITANYITSAFWGAFTLGRLLTIPLAAKLKASSLLWLCLGASAVSVIPMLLLPNSRVAMWTGSIMLGLSIAAIFPAIISFAERRIDIKGRVMGIFFTGVSLGGMSIPWLIGQLFETVAPYVMLVVVAISLALTSLLFALIMRRSQSQVSS